MCHLGVRHLTERSSVRKRLALPAPGDSGRAASPSCRHPQISPFPTTPPPEVDSGTPIDEGGGGVTSSSSSSLHLAPGGEGARPRLGPMEGGSAVDLSMTGSASCGLGSQRTPGRRARSSCGGLGSLQSPQDLLSSSKLPPWSWPV
jgi:hypothetical protein